jgi:hypothetical protein|tara:strand:+ start:3593 stop:4126 length:534 start_codon:yes stop_codon:yes gene_type:complete
VNLSRHKSLIREISPGVIQIGNSPFAPVLTLSELSGGVEASSAYLANVSGAHLQYENATFENRPTVSGIDVLLEGDITGGGGVDLTETINNTGELLENSITEVSGILQALIEQEAQDGEDADIILNNTIEQISGLLITEINQLQTDLTSISGDITNINGVTYEQAESLAKKWSIIFG